MLRLGCLVLVAALSFPFPSRAQDAPPKGPERILFLGDSNTYAGHYVTYLEYWLRKHYPDKAVELINLGLPSETASCLSEPAHPFPRPCVHERLDRALAKTKPNVVFIAYGMNDGIYYPPSAEHRAAYEKGLKGILHKVKPLNAFAILLTPPPFEAASLKASGTLKPAGAKEYAWYEPYEDYDKTLDEFSSIVLKLGGVQPSNEAAPLASLFTGDFKFNIFEYAIDTRTPLLAMLKEKQSADAKYHLAGDGIHFNTDGHLVIAKTIWKELGFEPADPGPLPSPEVLKLCTQRQELLRDAWLTDVGHKRPDMKKGEPLEAAQAKAAEILKQIQSAK
jgi:lysophospholipase L1-like esterase